VRPLRRVSVLGTGLRRRQRRRRQCERDVQHVHPDQQPGLPDRFVPNFNELGKDLHFGTNQFFFDFQGLKFLGDGAKAWIGRRFYKREDIHVTDYFWWNASGLGGGLEDIPVSGSLKLSYAAFVVEGPNAPLNAMPNAETAPPQQDIGVRNDLRLYGIPVHPGGELVLGVNAIANLSNNDPPPTAGSRRR